MDNTHWQFGGGLCQSRENGNVDRFEIILGAVLQGARRIHDNIDANQKFTPFFYRDGGNIADEPIGPRGYSLGRLKGSSCACDLETGLRERFHAG